MRTTPAERIEAYTKAGWWGEQTICDLLDAARRDRPEHLALVDPPDREALTGGVPNRLTYAELAERVDRLSSSFFEAGLRADDVAVLQLPNVVELPLSLLALARLGVIVSPVPVQYGPHELEHVSEKLRAAALVTTSRLKDHRPARAHVEAFRGRLPVLSFGDRPPSQAIPLRLEPGAPGESWSAYARGAAPKANDVFSVIWTSGTTGRSKGVPRSHNHWRINSVSSTDAAELGPGDVLLNPFPFVNMASLGGFLMPWLTNANTLVLHHPFDLQVFLEQIRSEGITYTIAAPAILHRLLEHPEQLATVDLSSLRAVGAGGAPVSAFIVEAFRRDYGIEVVNIFGSSEGLCLSSSARDLPDPADRAQYFPRYGLPGVRWQARVSAMTETRLVDLETREVLTEPGSRGELEISGPSVFDGYWGDDEDSRDIFSADGFFRTGDLFEIPVAADKQHYYRFVGRSKDIIVRGGVNISPVELDELLAAHPMLAAAAVAGYADEALGERVGVAVVPKPGLEVSLDHVTEYLRGRGIAVFKLPERLVVLEQIPINAGGKVMRAELRALLDAG